jgi:large subunit ribosomal protein L1
LGSNLYQLKSTKIIMMAATLAGAAACRGSATRLATRVALGRPIVVPLAAGVASVSSYHSRAHANAIPEHSITTAVQSLLQDIQARAETREKKSRLHQDTSTDATRKDALSTTKPHYDETIELAVHLALDPRKQGQALRGSIALPHGTGKKLNVVVFSSDEAICQASLAAGAVAAGGTDLVEQIRAGEMPVDGIQRCLATPDIMNNLTQALARVLGPRGLMPNAKSGTLLQAGTDVLGALQAQLSGQTVAYRTEKEGIVHVPVGKGSFPARAIIENIGTVMTCLVEAKPEIYGKGKKSGSSKKKGGSGASNKSAKYLLRASVTSTQGKGLRLDLRTVDPNSPFFLTTGEEAAAGGAVVEQLVGDLQASSEGVLQEQRNSEGI